MCQFWANEVLLENNVFNGRIDHHLSPLRDLTINRRPEKLDGLDGAINVENLEALGSALYVASFSTRKLGDDDRSQSQKSRPFPL